MTTTYDRLERRMQRAAQPSLFDVAREIELEIESTDERHLQELDEIERSRGGRWRMSEWLLPGELVIRDQRFTTMGEPHGNTTEARRT